MPERYSINGFKEDLSMKSKIFKLLAAIPVAKLAAPEVQVVVKLFSTITAAYLTHKLDRILKRK